MNLQKLAEFLHFFFFSFILSWCESYRKTQKHYPIALKFGTLKGEIRAHPDTKYINGLKVINNYLRKNNTNLFHAYRVNHLWQEAENRQGDRVTIEPQTFCYLKE